MRLVKGSPPQASSKLPRKFAALKGNNMEGLHLASNISLSKGNIKSTESDNRSPPATDTHGNYKAHFVRRESCQSLQNLNVGEPEEDDNRSYSPVCVQGSDPVDVQVNNVNLEHSPSDTSKSTIDDDLLSLPDLILATGNNEIPCAGEAVRRLRAKEWVQVCEETEELLKEVEMRQRFKDPVRGVAVGSRHYYPREYKNAFSGTEAVDWLVKEAECSREEAVNTLQKWLVMGVFSHVVQEYDFQDEDLFYRFTTSMSSAETLTEVTSIASGEGSRPKNRSLSWQTPKITQIAGGTIESLVKWLCHPTLCTNAFKEAFFLMYPTVMRMQQLVDHILGECVSTLQNQACVTLAAGKFNVRKVSHILNNILPYWVATYFQEDWCLQGKVRIVF